MLMQANNLSVSFLKENQKRIFGKERQQILKNLSFSMEEGECLGIIGESGSGKSTLGRVMSGLLAPDAGQALFGGQDIYRTKRKDMRLKTSIVFQDYTSSVNPRFRVRDIIGESLRGSVRKGSLSARIDELLAQVGLDEGFASRYPHQLSGGQLQRVCIARAVAVEPKVILLDEAVSSLDASTQVQVMDLLLELKAQYGFSYLFITHDLETITYFCDRVLFLQKGEFVEEVPRIADLGKVRTPYARRLLECVIHPGADDAGERAI